MKLLFCGLLSFLSYSGHAAVYEMLVQDGHKQTRFEVETSGNKPYLKSIGEGRKKNTKLNKKSAAHLNKRLLEIGKLKSHDISLCKGSFIALATKSQKTAKPVVGCIRSPLSTAQEMTRLANFLNLASKVM